jgi:hypothetical protein
VNPRISTRHDAPCATNPKSTKLTIASSMSHKKYLCPQTNRLYANRKIKKEKKTYPHATACTNPTSSSHPNALSFLISSPSLAKAHSTSGKMITVCTCETTCIDLSTIKHHQKGNNYWSTPTNYSSLSRFRVSSHTRQGTTSCSPTAPTPGVRM